MFQKILCPIDFSPGSDHALQVAVQMAATSDGELVLAHAWSLLPMVSTRYPVAADTVELIEREAERGLTVAAHDAARLGARRVSTRLLAGTAWDQIVSMVVDDPAFDLIVVGTHGRTGIARVLLGSVAEKVVRHAPCSVLAARPRGEVRSFRHVLCPIDFSAGSRPAVELAGEVTAPGGTGITLLHAIELPVVSSDEMIPADLFADVDRSARQLLEQWAADLRAKAAVPIATRIETGSPGARVLAVLDEDPAFDLVVVGSHGRTGLRRVLLGSVAEKLVRHAPCPVLVARRRT